MLWLIIVLGLAYFLIGGLVDAFAESEGVLILFWPALIPALILGGTWFGVVGFSKIIKKQIIKMIKGKSIPTPTEVMNGIVATVVLKEYQKWEHGYLKHKNITVDTNARVLIGGEVLEVNEELKKSITESLRLHSEWSKNKEKYEKEQRMLDRLQEFMQMPPEQLKIVS